MVFEPTYGVGTLPSLSLEKEGDLCGPGVCIAVFLVEEEQHIPLTLRAEVRVTSP
jgi:hypothetical protein